jgi:hypothetical protein
MGSSEKVGTWDVGKRVLRMVTRIIHAILSKFKAGRVSYKLTMMLVGQGIEGMRGF